MDTNDFDGIEDEPEEDAPGEQEYPVQPMTDQVEGVTLGFLRQTYGDVIVRTWVAKMRTYMVDGEDDARIVASEGWNPEVVSLLRDAVYQQERLIARRSAEDTFVDYVLRQEGCIRDLNDLIPTLQQGEKTMAAAVTAIKVKSDIFERVIKMGQDLDIVAKAPKRLEHMVVDGIDVSSMTDANLRETVLKTLSRFQKLASKYGNFEGQIVDVATTDPILSRETHPKQKTAGRGIDRAKGGRTAARNALVKRVKGV
jgi:hypothetical protein